MTGFKAFFAAFSIFAAPFVVARTMAMATAVLAAPWGPTATTGGLGGDEVTVFDEAGFQAAYMQRSGPRVIKLGAVITLTHRHNLKGPWLTIDGQGVGGFRKDAPLTDHFLVVASTHDIHITGARFYGGWAPPLRPGIQNTGCFVVDGDTEPAPPPWDPQPAARRFRDVRIDFNWFEGCADSGFDIWGGGERLTSAFNVHYRSFHPQTISGNSNVNARPGGEDFKTDVLLYGNVYAESGERLPKIKFVHNLDYVGNFIYKPVSYTSQNGTPQVALGVTLDADGNIGPNNCSWAHNIYGNWFVTGAAYRSSICGCDANPSDCQGVKLHYAGNAVFPPTVETQCKDYSGGVPHPRAWTVPSMTAGSILAVAGPPNRSAAEQALYDEIAAAVGASVPAPPPPTPTPPPPTPVPTPTPCVCPTPPTFTVQPGSLTIQPPDVQPETITVTVVPPPVTPAPITTTPPPLACVWQGVGYVCQEVS